MDKVTAVKTRKSGNVYLVTIKGTTPGKGYHDKPSVFHGELDIELTRKETTYIKKLENRSLVQAFWNGEKWNLLPLTEERFKKILVDPTLPF